MERVMKRLALLVCAIIFVTALSTCWNDFPFLDEVTDQVMVAKDLYLEVTGVRPVNTEDAVSPEDPIRIDFDRDIDLESVTATSIVITPAATWSSPTFTAGTLTIDPDSLDGEKLYTVTIGKEIKGTDGSSLRDPYTWSFTTMNAPSGTIVIKDRDSDSEIYTNSTSVRLEVSANDVVDVLGGMRYSMTAFVTSDDSPTWGALTNTIDPYSMGGTAADDGPRTLYYQFRDKENHKTSVKTVSIIQDLVAPSIVLNNPPTYINSSKWTSNVTITEAGSGVASYAWSQYSGTASVTLSPIDQPNTTVTGTADGTLRLRLIVTDAAGNKGYLYTSTTPYITVDITPPTKPTVTGPGNASTDTTPTFNWVGGGGGNGTFQYHLDSAAWSSDTTDTTFTCGTLDYGDHDFYVQERDDAGNWSSAGSDDVFIYPTYLQPAQYSVVDCSPRLQWWSGVQSYEFYISYRELGDTKFAHIGPTTAYYADLAPATLAINTTYQWYYTRKVGLRTYRFPPSTSEYFQFRTNTLK